MPKRKKPTKLAGRVRRPETNESVPMGAAPSQPLALTLALRYLGSARRDSFTSFLSATAVGGLALGVGALILALAALAGFQQALREEILSRTPEIEIAFSPNTDTHEARRAIENVAGVERTQLLREGQGWLVSEGRVRPLLLVGFDGEPPAVFPGIGRAEEEGIWLGTELLSALGLEVGDVVEIASSRPSLTPFGPQPRVRRLPLAGSFESGRTEHVSRAALPLAAAEALLGPTDYRILVSTGDLDRALDVAEDLERVVPVGATVRSWRDLNRALFFALRLEKSLMFLAVLLIVVVAALALVSDVTLLITAKQREIGMLEAMGARPDFLVRVFLLLGGFLALAGVVGGSLIGVGGAWALDHYRLLRLPSAVYFLDYVPFVVQPRDLGVVLMVTFLLSVAAAGYAAIGAASLEPTEALRR